jgi:protein-tyrosine-phosphatase/DNA-binding transcriptional ArsR family regulator
VREAELARRAGVYAALSEPIRLGVIDVLVAGDAAPSELQTLLGVPSNLLAHHVRVLEEAGLVERSRSEGDRRRTYLRLRRGVLADLAPAPGLAADVPVARVVFVCTRNSARSQLAAALWRRRSPVPVASAGTHPAEHVHPGAVAAARRHRIPMRRARPVHLDEVAGPHDLIIAVCDNAHEELSQDPDARRLHWSVPDPVPAGTDQAFDRAVENLRERIEHLAPHLPDPRRP